MKRTFWLLFSIFFLSTASLSAVNLVLPYTIFKIPGGKAYIEFYLSINGKSLNYTEVEGGIQANLEMTYLIEKGKEVIAFEKFRLNSPIYKNSMEIQDIIDMKRISVPNGKYKFTLLARDLVCGKMDTVSQDLREVNFTDDKLELSEIELATNIQATTEKTSFTKHGFEIAPNFPQLYDDFNQNLYFYQEIYNSHKTLGEGEVFLMEYGIRSVKSNKVIANLNALKRLQTDEVIPVIQNFNLKELPTGRYKLHVAIKNKKNEVITEKEIEFYQSNTSLINYSAVESENTFVDSLTNKDELAEYIRCLTPIASISELQFAQNQLAYSDLNLMQRFFLNFWMSRDNTNPERAWNEYKREVDLVQEMFGYGGVKGYTTDRGRIYLKYGKPSAMQNVPYQRDTYPYSIWQYYKLGGRTDRKIIFYSPSMEMLGYQVLHSNIPGEINNPNWQAELISATNPTLNNNLEVPDGAILNQEAEDLWNNPR